MAIKSGLSRTAKIIGLGLVLILGTVIFAVLYIFNIFAPPALNYLMRETKPFIIKGDAMYPNYKDGQYYLTDIYSPEKDEIKRGDVIVFKSPPEPEKNYIKRIIGVPGESIMIQDGNVYLNNEKLEESYINGEKTYTGSFLEESKAIIVPEGNYFVLGDNRPYSSDSREWGFVPEENIISKITTCYKGCD